MENVPNFALHLIFGSLGEKLKSETGYDIISTDLNDKVQEIATPAQWIVANDDKIAGKEHVENLFRNYGSNYKRLRTFPGEHASEREPEIINQAVDFLRGIAAEAKVMKEKSGEKEKEKGKSFAFSTPFFEDDQPKQSEEARKLPSELDHGPMKTPVANLKKSLDSSQNQQPFKVQEPVPNLHALLFPDQTEQSERSSKKKVSEPSSLDLELMRLLQNFGKLSDRDSVAKQPTEDEGRKEESVWGKF